MRNSFLHLVRVFLFVLGFTNIVNAQKITPHGQFLEDSVSLGEQIAYALWVKYPKDTDVVFPDSLFDYAPFELITKDYFYTRSDSTFSYDSAVYFVATYEIDSVQKLGLPLFLVSEYDSVPLHTASDSIILKHMITTLPDSVAMRVNTTFSNVTTQFNYPYLIVALVTLCIVILISFLVFGKQVSRGIKLYHLNKRHKKFLKQLTTLIEHSNTDSEKIIAFWKAYMGKLTSTPYTTLTTKEIISSANDDLLASALIEIDKHIYANIDKSLHDSYNELNAFANKIFSDKILAIKNER